MWMIAWLAGCGGAPAECGPKECADICAKQVEPAPAPVAAPSPEPAAPSGASMSPYESEVLGPLIEDIRGGVRPFGEDGIGICKASGKECVEYLGGSAKELPEGAYMLRANLRVPNVGEKGTWKVKFDLECTTTKKTPNGSSTSTSTQNKEYTVVYAGKERGYGLSPLWTIKSPGKYGAQDCKYKITGPHPDGDKVYQGSWTVPAAE